MKAYKFLFLFLSLLLVGACSEDTIDNIGRGTITGRVVHEGSNQPVENVKISTNPNSSTVFTDSDGYFVIENVPADDYSVQAKKDGLLTKFEAATVLSNAEVNVIFEMSPESASNKAPKAPTGIYPEDNAQNVDVTVDFAWRSSDPDQDSLAYVLELRNDMNDDVMRYSGIRDTTYTVEGLQYGYKYFWQVKVSDSINDPVLSPVYSFETIEDASRRYLFVKKINGNSVIFAAGDAGVEYQLTSSNQNSFRPRRNPASNKIAFLRNVGGQTQLFTMDPDGSGQQQITSAIPVNGFNLNKIGFSWAQDGAALVYPNFSKLYQVNATGGGTKLLYQTPDGKFITDVDVSKDDSMMAVLTNSSNGYNASIYTLNMSGQRLQTIVDNVQGALGGIDISVDKKKLLYTRDLSGYESEDYRQLDTSIFLYDFATGESTNVSYDKDNGTNDLDPRFSPNEADIIFVNTSNDGVSQKNILESSLQDLADGTVGRTELFQDAMMPDWE